MREEEREFGPDRFVGILKLEVASILMAKKKKKQHRRAGTNHQSQQSIDITNQIEVVGQVRAEENNENSGTRIDGEINLCVKESEHDNHLHRMNFYPFAYALHDDQLSSRCWYCLAKTDKLKRCRACYKGLFCNENCQTLGWKDHRSECKALKIVKIVPNIEVRLLGRIVARYKAIKLGKDKNSDFYTDRVSKRSILDIWSHIDRVSQDPASMKKFNEIYGNLLAFYGSKAMVSRNEVFELHCRNYINRHAISDSEYTEEIGKGLYLDLCAYDHSCRPNAIYTCNGFVATLRSLTDGVNLQDLSTTHYSYIDLVNTTQERRIMLRDTWYFECHCERCDSPNESLLSSILCPNCPEERERLCLHGNMPCKDKISQIITCPKCHMKVPPEYVLEAIAAMRSISRVTECCNEMSKEKAIQFLTNFKNRISTILPRINVFFCKIIQLLIPLIDASESQKLLDLHLESEECVRFCFPYNHPAVGIHYRSIGSFYLRCNQPHQALNYCKMAYEILKFTFGVDHSMTMEVDALLENALNMIKQSNKSVGDEKEVSATSGAPSSSSVHATKESEVIAIAEEEESTSSCNMNIIIDA
ncbi:unnamed protein product [Thelazia callipaeda]|uniref:MYND-type domain-containing protein n=1 Tax=Thelazia callipaeda TaxID=103827 RepID=A0A0N5CJ39_THECL|nr:unnamed protein product [Thelazia callipaeda]